MWERNLEKDQQLKMKNKEIAEKNRKIQDLRTRLESQALFSKEHGIKEHHLKINSLIETVKRKDKEIRKTTDQLRILGEEMQKWKHTLNQFGNLKTKGDLK